jgi:cyclophilin family peptidyl-prolyl cis-trans isomerase
MKQLFLTLALLGIVCLHPSIAAEKAADPKAPTKATSAAHAPQIQVFTSMGNFTIELNPERAPLTVADILAYVDSGHYTNTLIHRVVANFVIQGGGFNDDYTPKAAPLRVNNESGNGLSNMRSTVGLARTEDPHAGNAQFYVNLDDNAALDPNATRWGYAVFGRVIEGMDVVDRIGNVATGAHGPMKETPIKPVVILKIERVGGPSSGTAPKP